jgi:outer membrane protein insertion porin family
MTKQLPTLIFLLLWLMILTGCNTSRYLKPGEKLYTGAQIEINADSIEKKELNNLLLELNPLPRPRPNSTILGLRPKLLAYYFAGEPKKEKGLRHRLRNRYGEAPVFDYMVDLDFNSKLLENRLENRGYFEALVSADTILNNKKVKAHYTVDIGPQYKIKEVHFPDDASLLSSKIRLTAAKSFLKPGNPYNLETIRSERSRIDIELKELGFFYFNPDHILVKADSTIGNKQVNLYLTIKPETPLPAREHYKIGKVYVYPNYSINEQTPANDTLLQNGITLIGNNITFKPALFGRSLFFSPGELYSRGAHNQSLKRLISTGAFKLVTNRFEPNAQAESPTLDVYYYLTPLPRQSLRGEVLATTKSNNLTGTGISLSWRNRNTFGSAELLTVKAYGSFEAQLSRAYTNYNTYRLGGETSLSVPRFMLPFATVNTSKQFMPRTHFTVAYEILNRRELYNLNSFSALGGYKWKNYFKIEHEFNILNINYVRSSNVSVKYQQYINNNPLLRKVIDAQFIFGPNYSLTYNSQLERLKTNNIYLRVNIDLAGTIAGTIQQANFENNPALLLGNQYAQYAKTDADFRYYLRTGNNSTIATRVMAGVGIPYGNSRELPFVKQYYSGGSNSLRAFMARSVGPGTYRPAEAQLINFFPDQSGDIIIEMNVEYRAKLFSIVHGALFVDAGNIWLFNANSTEPGAHFNSDFINELAVGTGIGLRFDIGFLVLRTDLAFPLRKPWSAGNRWVSNEIQFGNRQWRNENLVFNLAIGYPF